MSEVIPWPKCPACGAPMVRCDFVCGTCWWKVPAKDRASIRAMRDRCQDTTTKLEKILRNLKVRLEQEQNEVPPQANSR
jgi:predicted amidophosphoribosyltransferase